MAGALSRVLVRTPRRPRWFPAAVDWTPAVGETFDVGGAILEVTEVAPPHRLAWTYGGLPQSLELAAEGNEEAAHEQWAEIHERYSELFGVDPEPGRKFAATLRANNG